jgi:hypothetical protein
VRDKITHEITRDHNLTKEQLDDWRKRVTSG